MNDKTQQSWWKLGVRIASMLYLCQQEESYKKDNSVSKWIILRGLKTKQNVFVRIFVCFFQILTIQKRKIYF